MKKFGKLLSQTMNDKLRQVFGDSASEFIYKLVERHVSLKQEEIGEKNEAFYACLKKLLGSEGAQTIQSISLKRLYLNLWREYEEIEEYFSCLDELYEIKFKLLISPSEQEGSVCN